MLLAPFRFYPHQAEPWFNIRCPYKRDLLDVFLWQWCETEFYFRAIKKYAGLKDHVDGWELVMATLGLFDRGLYPSICMYIREGTMCIVCW